MARAGLQAAARRLLPLLLAHALAPAAAQTISPAVQSYVVHIPSYAYIAFAVVGVLLLLLLLALKYRAAMRRRMDEERAAQRLREQREAALKELEEGSREAREVTIPPLVLNPDHTFGLAALEPGSRPPSLELSAAAAMQQQPQQQPHSARSVGSARGDHLVQGQASRQQRSPGALRQASARPSAAQLQALGQHSSQDLQPWLSSPRSVRPLYRQPSPRHSAAAAALSPSHSRSRGRRQQQPQSARGGSPGGVTVVVHGEQTPFGWAAVDEPAAGAAPAPPPSRIP